MKLFILVSTGQNVANILPVLELYRPGDRVVWLESKRAQTEGWSHGATAVIESHGLPGEAVEHVSFDEHPESLAVALKRFLANITDGLDLFWVGNGGTKPQSLAVARVLDAHADYTYLYSLSRPAGYEFFPEGLDGRRVYRPYRKARIQIEDVLRISGYQVQQDNQFKVLWPQTTTTDHLTPQYGYDAEYTLDVSASLSVRETLMANPEQKLLRLGELRAIAPEAAIKWKKSFAHSCRNPGKRNTVTSCHKVIEATRRLIHTAGNAGKLKDASQICPEWRRRVDRISRSIGEALYAQKRPRPEHVTNLLTITIELLTIDSSTKIKPGTIRKQKPEAYRSWEREVTSILGATPTDWAQLESLFNQALSLAQLNHGKLTQQKRQGKGEDGLPHKGGELLENATASRLLDWLRQDEQEKLRQVLAGVWKNIRIAREGKPEITVQELDIAILLRNGVLLVLECKAGNFDNKDLDARILNMQRSATPEANMAIVIPVFTQADPAEPYLNNMLKRWNRLKSITRLRRIPFTLPGQPVQCTDPVTGKSIDITEFETALGSWLQPYANE